MLSSRIYQKLLGKVVILKNLKLTKLQKRCIGVCGLSIAVYSGYDFYRNEVRASLLSPVIQIPTLHAAKVYDPGTGSGNNNIDGNSNKTLSQRYNFIADVVEKMAPGVVYIEIQGRHPYTGDLMTLSNGSGFIVNEDGIIVTNAHVVANRERVIVKLNDGRNFTGFVQYFDNEADLATVKIDCKNLKPLPFGSSNKLRPGEWVVAMGSPLSLSNTITAGVISSVHREGKEIGLVNKDMEYIQTDASITFGNSGGPLVNLDGEVIGINTMKVTAGISFAIPSDRVKSFLQESEQHLKQGSKKLSSSGKKRYLGITMLSLTPSIILELQQRQENFPKDASYGVLVWKIIVGSPAYNGGLQPGDVIVHINGQHIKSAADVYKALESDEQLQVYVLRHNEKLIMTILPQYSS